MKSTVFWTVVTAALLGWLTYRYIDLVELWRLLQLADPGPLVLSGLFFLLGLAAHAWRWWVLANRQPTFMTVLHVGNIGLAGNLIIPGRAGEPLRIGLLAAKSTCGVGQVTGSVVSERLIDQFLRCGFLAGALVLSGGGNTGQRLGPALGTLAGLTLLTVLFVAFHQGVARWTGKVLGKFPKLSSELVEGTVIDTARNIQSMYREGTGPPAVFGSLLCWVFFLLHVYFCLVALGEGTWWPVAFMVMAACTPTAPTQPGLYHGTVVLVLAALSIGAERALAWAILLHAFQCLLMPLTGAIGMLSLGLKTSDLSEVAHNPDDGPLEQD